MRSPLAPHPVQGDLEGTDTATVMLDPPFACRVKNRRQDPWFVTDTGRHSRRPSGPRPPAIR